METGNLELRHKQALRFILSHANASAPRLARQRRWWSVNTKSRMQKAVLLRRRVLRL